MVTQEVRSGVAHELADSLTSLPTKGPTNTSTSTAAQLLSKVIDEPLATLVDHVLAELGADTPTERVQMRLVLVGEVRPSKRRGSRESDLALVLGSRVVQAGNGLVSLDHHGAENGLPALGLDPDLLSYESAHRLNLVPSLWRIEILNERP